ncbi:MAG TPA: DUF433 domain-containing protein [Phycisphaerae bacterium]|jgi:uncharacterized protein (DUF433 family)|nr:DUF433 domain-containing protein [Phycisphaerae bacterium]HOB75830.1 DUF433 domain-containing protein [Phycisphaerae bacterium]HOJ54543.1 DUF433 domain-containing protein [Phycisphaerae bacterium]HOL27064.1 DUF433 domain-containing protein [Phycisphaerae bacterium]HPP22138.1 DUF433 domain-containing protein [Phycisphaerae bacterium]
MPAEIIDRGRGPEIAGTRITVYHILDYLQDGWHHTAIAAQLRLCTDEVLAAMRYIEEHRDEVMSVYQQIVERAAAGNPPEIQARLKRSRAKLRDALKRIQEQKGEEEQKSAGIARGR